MLTPEQENALDQRESDMKLCVHIVEAKEMGTPAGPMLYLLLLKGHMVMEGDTVGHDGMVHVEDHRLITVEMPMVPEIWNDFVKTINEIDVTVKRVAEGYRPKGYNGHGPIPPEDIANFMNSIPEIFLTNPEKDDDK